jgi:hypothetical protein
MGVTPRRRSLLHDSAGLTSTEYVILLLVVACIGLAAWKLFGTSTFARATSASGDVSTLGQSVDGPTGGGRSTGASGPRTRLEDATADATPPPTVEEEMAVPGMLLMGAVLLLVAMFARRGKGKKGGGDAKKS